MIVLDTDHLSILQHRDSPHADSLRQRIGSVKDEEVVTTVVTYEEQVRSWLAQIGRHSDVDDQVPFYDRLIRFADFFADWELLDPGLVPVMAWRPDGPPPPDPQVAYYWAGVARKR